MSKFRSFFWENIDILRGGSEQLSQYSDLLWAGWSAYRIPVGARFSAKVQTGPGTHSAFYKTGTESLSGLKQPGSGVDHPPPSSSEVKERVELYVYSILWGFTAYSRVNFTFTYPSFQTKGDASWWPGILILKSGFMQGLSFTHYAGY